jgi:hypothetical protein
MKATIYSLFPEKVVYLEDFSLSKSSKPLFLVCSIIHTPDRSMYGNKRSCFSSDERIEQTIETCKSIRKKCEDARILLLELSILSVTEIRKLCPYVFKIVLYSEEKNTKIYSEYDNKSVGELYTLNRIIDFIDQSSCSILFKISGRYKLLDTFSIENYSRDKMVFKPSNNCYYTILYSIPNNLIDKYKSVVKQSFVTALTTGVDVEHIFHQIIDKEYIQCEDRLNCEGFFSVNGEYINI